ELARGAVGGGGERLVAPAAAAAAGDVDLVAGAGQVAEQVAAVAVQHQRARRDRDDQILAALAVAQGRPARPAAFAAPVLLVDDLGQAVGAGDGADHDAAAVAAVAAVGAAARDVLLAAEAHHAPAAVAAFDVQGDTVNEH